MMNFGHEIRALKRMTVAELRQKHIELFGEPNRSNHKQYLIKRIAWRMQAQAEGGLSERARRRAEELANDADLRTHPPRESKSAPEPNAGPTTTASVDFNHDPRIPLPGSILVRPRPYKGRDIAVKVLPNGFEWEGEVYRTLTAVAKAVTGKHWNGYHFFQLPRKQESA